ncbi:hypothetical protein T4C_6660, partial [Trichinella pseudospiralis]
LMQWFLMCLKIHGLYSGVVLWYFGVYYAATLPDQASWTGRRGVLLGNMYLVVDESCIQDVAAKGKYRSAVNMY